MKSISLLTIVLVMAVQMSHAQQTTSDIRQLSAIVELYSKSVIERDSAVFYDLFDNGVVTWCAALKPASRVRELEAKGSKAPESNYFSGSHKRFMRSLFRYKTTEDKFDNISITTDGTVASVMMDYSFWANNAMTNWGNKYLTLIKKDGSWKITGVLYSLELTQYFPQPTLSERQRLRAVQ